MMLILSTALAGIVGELSDPVQFELNGTFNRVFPEDDGGWTVALGAGRGVKMQSVDGDLQALGQFEDVISGTEFIDIAITPCPDGGWLVAGSGNVESHNDSLWVYRLDANDTVVGNSTIVDRQQGANTNDMGVICSAGVSGVGWSNTFAFVDDEGQVTGTTSMPQFLMGAGFAHIDGQVYVTTAGGPQDSAIQLGIFDYQMNEQSSHTLSVDIGQGRVYWPQRMLKLDDDTYVVVSMARFDQDFQADEGNVWLHFYDSDWNLLESTQISQYTGPVGCMRPWVSRSGDTLVVSWDSEIKPFAVTATMGGVGSLDTSDTGAGDSGGGFGSDKGCGCDGSAGGALVLFALPWLIRRRREG